MTLTDAGGYLTVDIARPELLEISFLPLLFVLRQYLLNYPCGVMVDNARTVRHGHNYIQNFRGEKPAIK